MRLTRRALAWTLHASGFLTWRESRSREKVGLILTYHRVNDDDDPFFPALAVPTFEAQLDLVKSRYEVVGLEQLLQWLHQGPPGPPRVALTIDDGYADTHSVVLPRLRQRGLPATLFLATLPPEEGRLPWPDRLRGLFKLTQAERIELADHDLGPWPLTTPGERLAVLARISGRLKRSGSSEVEDVSEALWDQLGGRSLEGMPTPLSWAQVRDLDAAGVAIGAHTHNHYILSNLDRAEALSEIAKSMRLVRARVGHEATGFAYPNGAAGDYGTESLEALRELGVPWACTTREGPAWPGSPALELPRLHTATYTLPLFGCRLARLGQRFAGPTAPVE